MSLASENMTRLLDTVEFLDQEHSTVYYDYEETPSRTGNKLYLEEMYKENLDNYSFLLCVPGLNYDEKGGENLTVVSLVLTGLEETDIEERLETWTQKAVLRMDIKFERRRFLNKN